MVFVKHNLLKGLNMLTLGLGFLVIGVVLYNSETATYAGIIFQETSEWGDYPIREILNVTANSNKTMMPGEECPIGYNLLTFAFQGTNNICVKSNGEYTIGNCKKNSKRETLRGLEPVTLRVIND